jgi:hypothetical protein
MQARYGLVAFFFVDDIQQRFSGGEPANIFF